MAATWIFEAEKLPPFAQFLANFLLQIWHTSSSHMYLLAVWKDKTCENQHFMLDTLAVKPGKVGSKLDVALWLADNDHLSKCVDACYYLQSLSRPLSSADWNYGWTKEHYSIQCT